jgi:hypothetical protein
MTGQSSEKRVLALDVHPRSFGFVVFEGPNRIHDWGVKSFRRGVNAAKIPSGGEASCTARRGYAFRRRNSGTGNEKKYEGARDDRKTSGQPQSSDQIQYLGRT